MEKDVKIFSHSNGVKDLLLYEFLRGFASELDEIRCVDIVARSIDTQ